MCVSTMDRDSSTTGALGSEADDILAALAASTLSCLSLRSK